MFGQRIKLNKDLLEKCKAYAREAGYSSVEEFITHTLEKELRNRTQKSQEEEVTKRLKGLGYID